jgi:alpha-tubulin suppressor-like RCC1 family protein
MPVKITSLAPIDTIAQNDLIHIIDVGNKTMGDSGTNTHITAGAAANQLGALLTAVPAVIQTEIDEKANINNPTFTGNVTLPSTTSIGEVTAGEIAFVHDVTSPIQTQLDSKVPAFNSAFTGTITSSNNAAQSLTSAALHCTGTTGAILMDSAGHKRISWNDGDGNFNIRAGHYYNGTAVVYAKQSNENNGGAAAIAFGSDGADGNITMSAAPIGVSGTTVAWANNFILNKDAAYTDKNFGIGTTSPVDTLDANGSVVLRGNSAGAIMFAPKFGWAPYGTNYDRFEIYVDPNAQITTIGNSHGGTGVARALGLKTSGANRMTIMADGKVGIGTSAPTTALEVNGTITATAFSGSFVGQFSGNIATSTLAAKASTLAAGGGNGTAMTFNWVAGNPTNGQPLWLWGGSDAANMYVYNPSNFSVATATSATTATSAGSFTGSLAGDVTGTQGATTISAGTVTGKALTGYVSGAGTIAATDTILGAINKLNGNVGLKANIASPTLSGLTLSDSSIVFEGSSADEFETTLTVTNPTADRTITLPNVTGTIVTSGDTGSVTSTMILDGTINNADISTSAAIADTKLATISTSGKVANSATTATSNNNPNTIVTRDASGNFSAGTITGDVTGNVTGSSGYATTAGSCTGNAATASYATAAGSTINVRGVSKFPEKSNSGALLLGYGFTFIDSDNEIRAIGSSTAANALPATFDQYAPAGVYGPLFENIIPDKLYVNQQSAFVITTTGKVFAAGVNTSGGLGVAVVGETKTLLDVKLPDTEVCVKIALSAERNTQNTYFLTASGKVYVSGDNTRGQLGFAGRSTSYDATAPELTIGPGSPSQTTAVTDIQTVGSGSSHTAIALLSNGTVWVCGYGDYGQMGNGTSNAVNTTWTQVRTTGTTLGNIKKIYAAGADSKTSLYALDTNNRLWGWGNSSWGQLAQNNTNEQTYAVKVSDGVDKFWAFGASCFIKRLPGAEQAGIPGLNYSIGQIHSWGYNGYGQLGIGTTTNRTVVGDFEFPLKNINIENMYGSQDDGTPGLHVFAKPLSSNNIYSAGRGEDGELGINQVTDSTFFGRAIFPVGSQIIDIICSFYTGVGSETWVRTADNKLYHTGYRNWLHGPNGSNKSAVFSNVTNLVCG